MRFALLDSLYTGQRRNPCLEILYYLRYKFAVTCSLQRLDLIQWVYAAGTHNVEEKYKAQKNTQYPT